MVSLTEFASSPALEESEHKVVRSDAPPGADASQSGERGPVSMTQTGSSGSGSRPAGEMIVAGPAQAKGRRIEDVLTPLPMKVITQAALDHLQRTCGFNHVLFVTASDFVPGESIEDSYFIKPSMVCHNGQWAPCKNKAFNKRIAKGQIDLIAHLGGAPYYLGTYIITDNPEPMTAEYFQGLPDVVSRVEACALGTIHAPLP
ncbi:uncharacterized protein B0H18DRAFT_1037369 [Fomitopsis serialis]|uniref:uncharacterized protein n=1 Tax=Fomitopsis serialis TaxID=139415 RepID=UPI002007245E|nr:uncharacterized protein B0H18DRAFT_1037369 [Neoantrodia serialis]KAH9916827.1 hypothetical protein B0H18DRAFT_1037369 [Neoantrodia serialis]